MSRFVHSFALLVILCAWAPISPAVSAESDWATVFIDGVKMKEKAVVIYGIPYLPLSLIEKTQGRKATYDSAASRITIGNAPSNGQPRRLAPNELFFGDEFSSSASKRWKPIQGQWVSKAGRYFAKGTYVKDQWVMSVIEDTSDITNYLLEIRCCIPEEGFAGCIDYYFISYVDPKNWLALEFGQDNNYGFVRSVNGNVEKHPNRKSGVSGCLFALPDYYIIRISVRDGTIKAAIDNPYKKGEQISCEWRPPSHGAIGIKFKPLRTTTVPQVDYIKIRGLPKE